VTLDAVKIIRLTDSHVSDGTGLKRADIWPYRYLWCSVHIHR